MDVRVGPDKDVVDGEEDGEERDGEDVDGDGEKASDFLLVVQGLNVLYKHVLLVQFPLKQTLYLDYIYIKIAPKWGG